MAFAYKALAARVRASVVVRDVQVDNALRPSRPPAVAPLMSEVDVRGNRRRCPTISLGSFTIRPVRPHDLQDWVSAGYRR